MTGDWIEADELRALIRARFAKRGQPTQFAAGVGICDEVMLGFLRGVRDPADDLLHSLGWERLTFYRKVDPCACHRCAVERIEADPLPPERLMFGSIDPRMSRMFLCETCGNKRCPHAADHRNACTNSNEPGQLGSRYEAVATPPKSKGEPS